MLSSLHTHYIIGLAICQALFFIFFGGLDGIRTRILSALVGYREVLPISDDQPLLVAYVSCVSATFFQPVRSGSHLYSAHRNTVRSRTLSSRAYSLSWASTLWWLPCFPLCAFIIAHSWLFVKHFFEKSQFYFLGFRLHLLLSRSSSNLLGGFFRPTVEELGNTPWNRTFGEVSFRTLSLCVFIIAHFERFVKGFFTFFLRFSISFCGSIPIPTRGTLNA